MASKNAKDDTKPDLTKLTAFGLGTPPKTTDKPNNTHPGLKFNQKGYYEIPLKLIEEDPNQPRLASSITDESIAVLMDSIKANGLGDPVTIKDHPDKPGMYMIVNGARRFRAFTKLGRKAIPANFADAKLDGLSKLLFQFANNDQREQMDNSSHLKLITLMQTEYKLKATEIADALKKSKTWVTYHTKLLDPKNDTIRDAFEKDIIASPAVAYALTSMANKSEEARTIINEVLAAATEPGKINNSTIDTLKRRIEGKPEEPEGQGTPEQENYHPGPVIPYTTQQFREDRERDDEDDDEREPRDYTPKEKDDDDSYITSEDPYEETPTTKPRAAKVYFFAEYKEEVVTILAKEPTGKTKAIIKTQDGQEKEIPIKNLTLIRIAPE